MADIKNIQRLEELTLNTAPAIQQALYDGWILRASNTDTRRANSVTTLLPSRLPLAEKIRYCEEWYRIYGQKPIFRLTQTHSPLELDMLLAERGYTREVQTFVMTLDLTTETAVGEIEVPLGAHIFERDEAEGLRDAHVLKHIEGEERERDARRQALWKGRQLFASLRTHHGLAATGMARIEDGHLGIFNMRTAEKARGKGYASMLVSYLLLWGQAQGASIGFLQVDEANAAAIKVYRKFGFSPAYSYWHRVAPKAVAATV